MASRRNDRWLAALLGILFSLPGSIAFAADEPRTEPLRLSLVRGEGAGTCPDARVVAARVRDRLGRDPFSESAETAVEIVVAGQDGGYVARIRIRANGGALLGERTIASKESCDTLAAAVALAVALYVDPDAALRPPGPPARSAVATPALRPNEAAPPVAPTAVDAAPSPRPPTLDTLSGAEAPVRGAVLTAGVFAVENVLPVVAPGARIGAELLPVEHVHILVTGALLPEQRTGDGRYGFGLSAGGVGACVDVLASKRFELAPCATALLGEIHSVVYALVPTSPGDRFWGGVAAIARVRARVLSPLFVELGLGAWIPAVRYQFDVTGRSGPVLQETWAAPVVDFGVGAAFP
jgi:hypothetical protein